MEGQELDISIDDSHERDKQPVINILGERVALGPHRREDISLFYHWYNDFSTLRTLHIPRPSTLEEEQTLYDTELLAERTREAVFFTIYELATLLPIGETSLREINYRDRTAGFGIMIGEPERRGKGFGSEAAHLTLDYAFTALGLHNVLLEVWEYNLAGQRAYSKAGFRECGRRRQAKFMGGNFWDVIYMECLSTEFTNSTLKKILIPDKQKSAKVDSE
jgi:diamine N-acetyltransferase